MHDPVISDRMTEPPAHFTEATLLYAMEHIAKYVSEESFRKILNETSGLGTPATRAEIIDGAVRKDFLVREGKSLLSTPKARDLMHLLPFRSSRPASPQSGRPSSRKSPEAEHRMKRSSRGSAPGSGMSARWKRAEC